jgi:hypothetical protein
VIGRRYTERLAEAGVGRSIGSRLLGPIGNMPPAEAEQRCFDAMMNQYPMAA